MRLKCPKAQQKLGDFYTDGKLAQNKSNKIYLNQITTTLDTLLKIPSQC